MSLKTNVSQLNDLINKGEMLEAITRFYDENVVIQENEAEPKTGKQAFLEKEKQTLARTKSLEARLLNQAIDEEKQVVFGEWEYLFVNHKDQRIRLTEVTIQQWEAGLIVREKFYYKELINA